jgi:hypothetical protein
MCHPILSHQVLLRSCADWTTEERSVVKKILSAMGITVTERRAWLARLRQDLTRAAAEQASIRLIRSMKRREKTTGPGAGSVNSRAALRGTSGVTSDIDPTSGSFSSSSGSNPGISPAAFLHCLRENNVMLTIEEEAALLDCLDIERLVSIHHN